ncbi:hypothetical protein MWU54_07125 [Marivita sp. S6314]|uniref:hypothetical protein n=1 Tax=Marivita sp. S6314 TaxID=2926406 RepID=UPI001FF24536|nr:hypothetical protein [Marivita sp. S6314]MCK0149787.1 hypothetical protein [Marivita sp. S6314]
MAAISLIAGSVLGWLCAAAALLTGALASTALIVFLTTSLGFAATTLYVASLRIQTNT